MCDRASNPSVTLHFETNLWWQLLSVLCLPFLYFKSSDVWKASMFCARLAVLCLLCLYFNPLLLGKLQTLCKFIHCIFKSLEKCLICVIVSHGWLMFEITEFLDKECLLPFPDILNKFYPWIHKCPVLFLQQFLNASVLSLIFRNVLLLQHTKIIFQKQFLKCVVWCCIVTVEKVQRYLSDRIDIKQLSKCIWCNFCIILWELSEKNSHSI